MYGGILRVLLCAGRGLILRQSPHGSGLAEAAGSAVAFNAVLVVLTGSGWEFEPCLCSRWVRPSRRCRSKRFFGGVPVVSLTYRALVMARIRWLDSYAGICAEGITGSRNYARLIIAMSM